MESTVTISLEDYNKLLKKVGIETEKLRKECSALSDRNKKLEKGICVVNVATNTSGGFLGIGCSTPSFTTATVVETKEELQQFVDKYIKKISEERDKANTENKDLAKDLAVTHAKFLDAALSIEIYKTKWYYPILNFFSPVF